MIVLALVAGLVLAVVFIILGRRGSAADKQPATQPEEPPEPAAKAKDDDKAKSGPSLKKLAKAAKARDTAPRTEDKLFFTALKGHTEGVLHAVFTPDGKYLASCSPDRTIRLWHTENFASSDHTHIRSNVEYDHATSLCVSQDGHALAASLESSKIRLFKVANKTMTHVIDIHENHDYKFGRLHNIAMAATPTHRYIVLCYENHTVDVLHPKGELAERFDSGHNAQYFAAVSPCGRYFGVSGFTPDVRLYSATCDNGRYVGKVKAMLLTGHRSGVLEFAFSLDSRRAATVSKDGTWRAFDIDVRWELKEDVRLLATNNYSLTGNQAHVALSHDGLVVAVASGNTIEFFSSTSGSLLYRITDAHLHGETINSIHFDNESRYLASAGRDRQVRLWRNAPGLQEKIRVLQERLPRVTTTAGKENIRIQVEEATKALAELGIASS